MSGSRSRRCPKIRTAPPSWRNPNAASARSGRTTRTMSLRNCSRGDLVLLPIPFTDLSSRKVRRPSVIGKGNFPGDIFVVSLTSQIANADYALVDWQSAGLNVPSGNQSAACHRGICNSLGVRHAGQVHDQACGCQVPLELATLSANCSA